MPPVLAILTLVGVAVSLSMLGFFIVNRMVPVAVRRIHNDVAGFVFAILGAIYGVLLAFVVIVVWEQFNDANQYAENESSSAIVLFRVMSAYPDKEHARHMRDAMVEFARLELESRAAPQREIEDNGDRLKTMGRLWETVETVSPSTPAEQVIYGAIWSEISELAQYRGLRLQSSIEELPSVVWIAVVGGAIITIGFVFLFGTENVWAHVIILALLSSLIAIIVYVVIELNHPALGVVSIQWPEGYQSIVELAGPG